jgi:chloramphenicol-sensitive protein RarD
LLAVSGVMTAVPLVAHAAAINLLPLAVVGVLQYLNPTIQFLIGVLFRHEAVTGTRWIGFAVIWCSLAVFVTDSLRGALVDRLLVVGVSDRRNHPGENHR